MAPLSSRAMQRVWLTLATAGYLETGIPMLMESVRSGNILFPDCLSNFCRKLPCLLAVRRILHQTSTGGERLAT